MVTKKEGLTLAIFLSIIILGAAMFIGTYMNESVTGAATRDFGDILRGKGIEATDTVKPTIDVEEKTEVVSEPELTVPKTPESGRDFIPEPDVGEDMLPEDEAASEKAIVDKLLFDVQSKIKELEDRLRKYTSFSTKNSRELGEICRNKDDCVTAAPFCVLKSDGNKRCSTIESPEAEYTGTLYVPRKELGEFCEEDDECSTDNCGTYSETLNMVVDVSTTFLGKEVMVDAFTTKRMPKIPSGTNIDPAIKFMVDGESALVAEGETVEINGISVTYVEKQRSIAVVELEAKICKEAPAEKKEVGEPCEDNAECESGVCSDYSETLNMVVDVSTTFLGKEVMVDSFTTKRMPKVPSGTKIDPAIKFMVDGASELVAEGETVEINGISVTYVEKQRSIAVVKLEGKACEEGEAEEVPPASKEEGEACKDNDECESGNCGDHSETLNMVVDVATTFLGKEVMVDAFTTKRMPKVPSGTKIDPAIKFIVDDASELVAKGETLSINGISVTYVEKKTSIAVVKLEGKGCLAKIEMKEPTFFGRFFTGGFSWGDLFTRGKGTKMGTKESSEEAETPESGPGSYEFEIASIDKRLKKIQDYVCEQVEDTIIDRRGIKCGGDD